MSQVNMCTCEKIEVNPVLCQNSFVFVNGLLTIIMVMKRIIMDVTKTYCRSDTLPSLNKKLEVPTFLLFKNAMECINL